MKKLFTVLALTFAFLSGPLSAQTSCGTDTVYYTWYKTSQFRAVSLNTSTSGNSFAQYFPAPQSISVAGFDFFAWQSQGTNAVVTLTCNLFRAGSDSLPVGTPLRTITVNVDSSFKGGQLADLRKSAVFSSPVTVNFPYVITIETSSSINVSVICNDYLALNGDQEWLSSVRIGTSYLRSYVVNVGGTTFDADWIVMPQVSYSLSADFSFVGCNDSSNTITFTNKSSAIMENRFYNLYAFYGITQICYQWNYGDGSGIFYSVNGTRRYNTRNDYNITLKDTLYGWRVGCTASKTRTLYGTPLPPAISNDGPHCSGVPLNLFADSVNGATYSWTGPKSFSSTLRNPSFAVSDTSLVGTYSATVTVNGCTSNNATTNVVINQTPKTPVATNDGPKCVGDSVEFVVNTFDPGIQTTWTGPNTFSSNNPSFKFTNVDTTLRGEYIVYTETAFCKSAPDTTNFYVYPPPSQPSVGVLTNDTLCNGDTLYLVGNSVPGAVFSWTGPDGFTSAVSHPVIPNATAIKAGKYKTHVIIGSCTSTPDSIEIAVNPRPTVSITASDTSFCDGDSAGILTSSTGLTYEWMDNGVTIPNANAQGFTVKSAGKFSLKGTNSFGCSDVSETVEITVRPLPNITQHPVNKAVNSGNNASFTITANAGAAYQWQADAGSGFSNLSNTAPYSGTQTNTLTITNTTPGLTGTKYRCVVTNNSCESISNDVVLTINVGISELLAGGKLAVYPNPATTQLTVDLQLSNPQPVTLSVMDITGRVFVLPQTLATSATHTHQLDITRLDAGIYLLQLTAGDETAVVRFVVE